MCSSSGLLRWPHDSPRRRPPGQICDTSVATEVCSYLAGEILLQSLHISRPILLISYIRGLSLVSARFVLFRNVFLFLVGRSFSRACNRTFAGPLRGRGGPYLSASFGEQLCHVFVVCVHGQTRCCGCCHFVAQLIVEAAWQSSDVVIYFIMFVLLQKSLACCDLEVCRTFRDQSNI